jgi:hypothetical protein
LLASEQRLADAKEKAEKLSSKVTALEEQWKDEAEMGRYLTSMENVLGEAKKVSTIQTGFSCDPLSQIQFFGKKMFICLFDQVFLSTRSPHDCERHHFFIFLI